MNYYKRLRKVCLQRNVVYSYKSFDLILQIEIAKSFV